MLPARGYTGLYCPSCLRSVVLDVQSREEMLEELDRYPYGYPGEDIV